MADGFLPASLLAVAAAATYASRGLGVLLSGRINPSGPLFTWVGLVTYALLAGLVARMILLPIGALQETALLARLAATALAMAVFFAARRNLLLGVASGALLLVLLSA